MLQTKLFTYLASTLLANALIVESLLPAYAKSFEILEARNTPEELASIQSFPTYTDSRAETYSNQFYQGELMPDPLTFNTSDSITTAKIPDIEQQFLFQYFESRLLDNDIEAFTAIELDLDSILDAEFEENGVVLATKCCL